VHLDIIKVFFFYSPTDALMHQLVNKEKTMVLFHNVYFTLKL